MKTGSAYTQVVKTVFLPFSIKANNLLENYVKLCVLNRTSSLKKIAKRQQLIITQDLLHLSQNKNHCLIQIISIPLLADFMP